MLNWGLSGLLVHRSGSLLPVGGSLSLELIRVVFGLILGFSFVVPWPVLPLLLSASEVLLALVRHILPRCLLLSELLRHHHVRLHHHHRVELRLKWHSHPAELVLFAHHHRVELLHHERVHELVHHELRERLFLVSVLGVLEMTELVFLDQVGQVDLFIVEIFNLGVVLGFFDGLFGALFVQEVDVPEVGVEHLVWVLQGEGGIRVRFDDDARTDFSVLLELLLQFFLGDFGLQELGVQVGLVAGVGVLLFKLF